MRQTGLAAEALECHSPIAPQLADAGAQQGDRIGGGLLTVA